MSAKRLDLPFLHTVDEVAAMLRTSRAAVYAKVARGELPVVRDGRRLLFEREALLQWVAGGRAPSSGSNRG